jgi:tetraacyldisaccharide 4'-kinase
MKVTSASAPLNYCPVIFNHNEGAIQSCYPSQMSGRWIRRVWERRGILGILLWLALIPISCVYGWVVQIRNLFYAIGWKTAQNLDQFVLSIGNLTVGGTGKTPTVIWVAQELQKRGLKIVVLSRGYNRKGNQPRVLTANFIADVDGLGDEPAMMARLFGLTVAVASTRYQAAVAAVKNQSVDIFILDDGFQHRQLARDLDLLLLGSDSTGWVLPAGPFREPRKTIRRADFLLVTGARDKWQRVISNTEPRLVFRGAIEPVALIRLELGRWQEHPLSLLARRRIIAVAGIANPEPFYRMIRQWEGEIVDVIEFEDHHRYSAQDWQRISRAAQNADLIITTEKDILKLTRFPFGREQLLALRVAMVVESGERLIQTIVDAFEERHKAIRI